MSYYFLFTTRNSSVLSSKFFPPIELDPSKQYCIGLVNFVCFNSIFNVTKQNNQFCYLKNSEKLKPSARTTRTASATTITVENISEDEEGALNSVKKRALAPSALAPNELLPPPAQKLKPNAPTSKLVGLPLVNPEAIDILTNAALASALNKIENGPPTTLVKQPVIQPVAEPPKQQQKSHQKQTQFKPPLKYGSTTEEVKTKALSTAAADQVFITIPPGAYEADNIRDYLKKHFDREFDLRVNESMKTEVDSTYKIDWNCDRGIGSLLGFTGKEKETDSLKEGLWFWVSEKNINITNVTAINISCNLVSQAYLNGVSSHILHSFSLDVAPGYSIVETPHNIIYLPIIASTPRINEILLEVRDQNWDLIDFQNEQITVVLHLKEL
jgi:hypothetical protein